MFRGGMVCTGARCFKGAVVFATCSQHHACVADSRPDRFQGQCLRRTIGWPQRALTSTTLSQASCGDFCRRGVGIRRRRTPVLAPQKTGSALRCGYMLREIGHFIYRLFSLRCPMTQNGFVASSPARRCAAVDVLSKLQEVRSLHRHIRQNRAERSLSFFYLRNRRGKLAIAYIPLPS